MRLIDADALDDVVTRLNAENWGITVSDYKMIDRVMFEFPTVDTSTNTPTNERRGKWEWSFADNGWADWKCSVCGWTKNTDVHINLGYRYCPNCGAKMEEEG